MKKLIYITMLVAGSIITGTGTASAQTTIKADAGANKSICCQSTNPCVTIGGSPAATCTGCGTVTPTYSWSPGGSTSANPSVCPATTTTYTLAVTYSGFGTVYDHVVVSIAAISCCRVINPADDEINTNDVTLYPNPSDGQVNLSFSNMEGVVSAAVYDSEGKMIEEKENVNSKEGIKFDLGAHAKGIYFIQVVHNNKVAMQKKVILK
jgi:hypothetical protein